MQLKNNVPFLKKVRYFSVGNFSTKKVTIGFWKTSDTSIEKMASLLKSYLEKYGEK